VERLQENRQFFREAGFMVAAEFQTKVIDGKIEIPEGLRDQFSGAVNVILFAQAADQDESPWPEQNRRRWILIARKIRQAIWRFRRPCHLSYVPHSRTGE